MAETRLPIEVELAYQVMPCNAMRTAEQPGPLPHACSYFREWGTYHSYDYVIEGAPAKPGIDQPARYLGRAPLIPEILSGCRKAPIVAVGINPNLPGWWPATRRALNPVFDDYRQYAHYFRYRATTKLELSETDYVRYGGGPHDTPFSGFELAVPPDGHGDRMVAVHEQPQKMYLAYQSLLDSLAGEMHWPAGTLTVGEDLAYGNMVHCPSAKWTTVASDDPALPPMTPDQRDGIVSECFRKREYFLRQLFQSLPAVILVFGQSTANAFIGELQSRFTVGAPALEEPVEALVEREIRLRYGRLPDGGDLDARVIFAPHITGNPAAFAPVRKRVVGHLVAEARLNRLQFQTATGHLGRPAGACVFCTMLEIGPCDYLEELRPLAEPPELASGAAGPISPPEPINPERGIQASMRRGLTARALPVRAIWTATDESREGVDREALA